MYVPIAVLSTVTNVIAPCSGIKPSTKLNPAIRISSPTPLGRSATHVLTPCRPAVPAIPKTLASSLVRRSLRRRRMRLLRLFAAFEF
jgi:hypothetical protein